MNLFWFTIKHNNIIRIEKTVGSIKMVSFASYVLPTHEEVKCIFNNLSKGPMKACDLLIPFELNRRPFILRILVSLLKFNLIKLV